MKALPNQLILSYQDHVDDKFVGSTSIFCRIYKWFQRQAHQMEKMKGGENEALIWDY